MFNIKKALLAIHYCKMNKTQMEGVTNGQIVN